MREQNGPPPVRQQTPADGSALVEGRDAGGGPREKVRASSIRLSVHINWVGSVVVVLVAIVAALIVGLKLWESIGRDR